MQESRVIVGGSWQSRDVTSDISAPAPLATTIITGATVLSETTRPHAGYAPADDPAAKGTVTFLADHAIGIAGDSILWMRPSAEVSEAEKAAAEIIDARGQLAMPGLINGHTHSPMTMFRGSAEGVPAEPWFNDYIWPMEVNLTPRDVRLGAQIAVGEMLLAGVTSFADHYFATEQIAEVVAESGIRAMLASTFFSSQGPAGLDASAAFAEQWNGAADGRITTALGPHAVYTVDDADLEATARRAIELGLPIHVHAAEDPFQTASSLEKRGVTPIKVLHDTGVLEAGGIIAHGVGILEDDLQWLTPYADRIAVAACSKTYLKFGQRAGTPVRMLHDAGITVGIGTDGAASNNDLDIMESLRMLTMMQKTEFEDPTWFSCAHALDLATAQSAKLFGQADSLGRLLPGYRADIVLLDTRRPHLQPIHDLAATLVLSAKSSDVNTVLVAGRVVVRDRTLLTLDLDATIDELTTRIPELTDRSHGRSIQEYAP